MRSGCTLKASPDVPQVLPGREVAVRSVVQLTEDTAGPVVVLDVGVNIDVRDCVVVVIVIVTITLEETEAEIDVWEVAGMD